MPRFAYRVRRNDGTRYGALEAPDSRTARLELENAGLRVLRLQPDAAAEPARRPPALSSAALRWPWRCRSPNWPRPACRWPPGCGPCRPNCRGAGFAGPSKSWPPGSKPAHPDTVLAAAAARLPAHVRGMLAAGTGSGRLFEVLQECLELEQLQTDIRRRILAALAYPLIVLSMAAAWVAFVLGWLVPMMKTIYDDFQVELPATTAALVRLSQPGFFIGLLLGFGALIILLAAGLIWRGTAVSRLTALLPLVGPLWRAGHLSAFCRLLATMLDESLPLAAALRLTAEGVADADIKIACCRAADGVESGRALSDCLVRERAMPPTLALIVRRGERLGADGEALRAAAELFGADGNAGRPAGRGDAADRVSGRCSHHGLGRPGAVLAAD